MPVAALLVATRRFRHVDVARAALICAAIGIAGIVGILIEPNTYKASRWWRATRRAVVAHVATSAALAMAGFSVLRRSRCTEE